MSAPTSTLTSSLNGNLNSLCPPHYPQTVAGAFLWSMIHPTLTITNMRQLRQDKNAEAIPGTWEEMVKYSSELKKRPEETEKNLLKLKLTLGM